MGSHDSDDTELLSHGEEEDQPPTQETEAKDGDASGSEDSDGDKKQKDIPYELLGSGGYAKVYIDRATDTVVRYQKKYRKISDKVSYLDHCMMLDLAVTHGFNKCIGMPYLHSHDLYEDPDRVKMMMRNHGISLYEMKKTYWAHEISEHLPTILYPVLQSCMMLYDNAIQHTDIKPSNIVVRMSDDENDESVPLESTLIDFNSVSMYVCCGERDNDTHWTYGIGTWNYVAPEILTATRPENTSMVWSFGVLIAYMIGWHPYEYQAHLPKGVTKEPSSQRFWTELLRKRRQQSAGMDGRYPLSERLRERLKAHSPFWLDIVEKCLVWDPRTRMGIHQLFAKVAAFANRKAYSTRFFANYIGSPATLFAGHDGQVLRTGMIDRIYMACDKVGDFGGFVRAVSFLDRAGPGQPVHDPDDPAPVDACCLMLAWMLENRYVMDDSVARRTLALIWPRLKMAETGVIYDRILGLCERLGWRLLQVTADVILSATTRPKDAIHSLYQVLRDRREPYTQRELSNRVCPRPQST